MKFNINDRVRVHKNIFNGQLGTIVELYEDPPEEYPTYFVRLDSHTDLLSSENEIRVSWEHPAMLFPAWDKPKEILKRLDEGLLPFYAYELELYDAPNKLDGLFVMRGQPLHFGHIRTIDTALATCDRIFIVLGSTQEFGTSRNPFNFPERKKMIKTYYKQPFIKEELWEKIIIMGLPDIFSLRWPMYVMDEISKWYPDANIKTIYGGSQYDCDWFKDLEHIVCDRAHPDFPFASASMIRDMIMYKDKRWMQYVPECNWHLIAKKFNRLDMLE